MSAPGPYRERPALFTAVQWDGSSEARDWIVSVYPGAQLQDEDIVVVDAMDRRVALDRDIWVLRSDLGVTQMTDDAFRLRYEPA